MSIDPDEDCLHRRHVLCGGGAFMFAAMMASLLESYKPVRAQAITGNVTEVDRVSVRVVLDGYQFAVAAGKQVLSTSSTLAGALAETSRPGGHWLVSLAWQCMPNPSAAVRHVTF